MLLAAIVAGGWFGRVRAVEAVGFARDRISHEIVLPEAFAASSASRGHAAKTVGDGAPNQYWSPRPTGTAAGEFVTLDLEEPIRLAYITLYNGPTSEPGKAYHATARVHKVELTMTRPDGGTETQRIRLVDVAGAQNFHVGVDDVVSVRLTIRAAYGAGPNHRVALGEVELFKRP